MRRDKWWVRELERRDRQHAEDRRLLLETLCVLVGKPSTADSPDAVPDADEYAAEFSQQPHEPVGHGDELLTIQPEE